MATLYIYRRLCSCILTQCSVFVGLWLR